MSRRPRRRRRAAAICGAMLAAGAPAAARELPPDEVPNFYGPFPHWSESAILELDQGFVATIGERRLLGDAVRYDVEHQEVYALGDIVYAMPGVRIGAERIGLRLGERSGDAWNVEAEIETPHGPLPVRAARVRIQERVVEFDGVKAGPRYGGLLSLGVRRIRVHLRDRQAKDREGAARAVEGVTFIGTSVRFAGIPLLWLPWLHRDFIIDYPWTRYRFGHSGRLGDYVQAWLGSSIPPFWGTHLTVQGRADHYATAGAGYGANLLWHQDVLGHGMFEWFGMHPEHVIDANHDEVDRRVVDLFDVEHQARLPGGALYARWLQVPDPDPVAAGDPLPPSIDRFRADYLRDDLEHRPFARRGAALAWGVPYGTVVLDTERRHHESMTTVDRLWGVELEVPDTRIVGPVQVAGDGWVERLRRDATADEATRVYHVASLRGLEWFGGLGLDAEAGVRGLHYADREAAGVELDDATDTYVPFADTGVRLRFTGRWGERFSHDVEPRLGLELYDRAHGESLPTAPRFGDARDELVEDRRYWTASLTTALRAQRELVRLEGIARFALRPEDRVAFDDAGVAHTSASDFVEAEARASSSPHARISLSGSALYDARLDEWTRFDAIAAWRLHPHVTLTNATTLLPVDGLRTDVWQETPGAVLRGGRYDLGGKVSFKPGGETIDRWTVELTRHLVDGTIGFGYELARDVDGRIYDQRTSLTIVIP